MTTNSKLNKSIAFAALAHGLSLLTIQILQFANETSYLERIFSGDILFFSLLPMLTSLTVFALFMGKLRNLSFLAAILTFAIEVISYIKYSVEYGFFILIDEFMWMTRINEIDPEYLSFGIMYRVDYVAKITLMVLVLVAIISRTVASRKAK